MIELPTKERRLTVGLLAASAGARTTELLRLAAARVGDQQGAIVRHKDVLDLPLGGLVDVLLVVGDDGLGNRLPDRVDLRGVATALHAKTDVNVGKALAAQQQNRLEDLVAEHLGLDKLNGAAIDLDQATALLAVRDGHGRLLATESLHALHF